MKGATAAAGVFVSVAKDVLCIRYIGWLWGRVGAAARCGCEATIHRAARNAVFSLTASAYLPHQRRPTTNTLLPGRKHVLASLESEGVGRYIAAARFSLLGRL